MRISLRALASPSVLKTQGLSYTGRRLGRRLEGALLASASSTTQHAVGDGAIPGPDGSDRAWRVDVPGVAEAVPMLRRWVRMLLAEKAELAEAFELIVSEYGANALGHTASGAPGGRIRVELLTGGRQTRLIVLDDGPSQASAGTETDPAEHGRGLILADAYADATGQDDTADGHAAWALINH